MAYRSSASNSVNSGTSHTVTLPSDVVDGDTLIAALYHASTATGTAAVADNNSGAWTPVSGFPLAIGAIGGASYWTRIAIPGDAEKIVTFTHPSTRAASAVVVVPGTIDGTPVSTTTTVDSLSLVAPSATPTADNITDTQVSIVMGGAAAGTTILTPVTVASPLTIRVSQGSTHGSSKNAVVAVGTNELSSDGPTGTVTFTANANVDDQSRITFLITPPPTEPVQTFDTVTTDWVATGGTAVAVLADNDDATYITSPGLPVDSRVTLHLDAIEKPAGDFVVNVRHQRLDSTTATLVPTLRTSDDTLLATATTINVSDAIVDTQITFTAASIDTEVTQAQWRSGTLRVCLDATAT